MELRVRVMLPVLALQVATFGPVLAAPESSSEIRKEKEIDIVRVTGTRMDIASAKADAVLVPGNVSVTDMDVYRDRTITSLADVMRYVPGIWATSNSGNDSLFISSRGSNLDATGYDMNGIKLLQDGLPVTTADGSNHNRIVDPLSARHAVVAHGANALSYGASTLGGAIDFITATAHDEARIDLLLNGGSNDLMQGRLTASGIWDQRFDALATIELKGWGGFREHSEQERRGFYANAGWQVDDSVDTRFYATWLDNDQEFPGQLTREQFKDDPLQAADDAISGNYQLDVRTARIANRTSWQINSRSRLEFGVSMEKQDLYHPIVDRIMVDFDGPGPEQPAEVFSLLVDTDQTDSGVMGRFTQTLNRHELLFGINYGHSGAEGGNYRNLHGERNGLTTVIDNSASSLEAFAMDRWQASERWLVILALQGVRADREVRNTDVESGALLNPEDTYSAVNPRAGVIFQPIEGVSLFASLSRFYEPPTNFELQDDVSGGSSTLKAMSGRVLEFGTRGAWMLAGGDQLRWEVAAYYANIDEEILSVEDPAEPGTNLTTNIDETVHAGIEALFNGQLALGASGRHSLEPLFSLTVNNFHFSGDAEYGDNNLPAAPDYAIRGELMYRHVSGFHFGPTFEWIGSRFADFRNTYVIGSHDLYGLRAGWSNEAWSFTIEVENMFDEEYVANHTVRVAASESDALLNPGAPRSIYATLRWRYD